jgi:hypothetical protein
MTFFDGSTESGIKVNESSKYILKSFSNTRIYVLWSRRHSRIKLSSPTSQHTWLQHVYNMKSWSFKSNAPHKNMIFYNIDVLLHAIFVQIKKAKTCILSHINENSILCHISSPGTVFYHQEAMTIHHDLHKCTSKWQIPFLTHEYDVSLR